MPSGCDRLVPLAPSTHDIPYIPYIPRGFGDTIVLRAFSSSSEARFDILAQQLHCGQHLLMRDEAAAIELGENAAEADFLAQRFQTLGDRIRCADQRVIVQPIFV